MLRFVLVGFVLLATAPAANAAFITGITSATTNTSTIVPGNVNSNGGTVALNVIVNSTSMQNVSWTFGVFNTNAVMPQSYNFTVTMTNNIAGGNHPLSPTQFVLGGALTGAGLIDFNYGVAPTSTYNGASAAGQQPTSLTFGGLAGGGGELYFGQTATFTFTVNVPNSAVPLFGANQTFTLTLVPNPEPTTLALACLPLAAAGYFARRRRQTVAAK